MTGDVDRARAHGTDGKLTGTKTNVPFGTVADAFLVSAIDGIYLVETDAPGVTRRPARTRSTTSPTPSSLSRTLPGTLIAGPDALGGLIDARPHRAGADHVRRDRARPWKSPPST